MTVFRCVLLVGRNSKAGGSLSGSRRRRIYGNGGCTSISAWIVHFVLTSSASSTDWHSSRAETE